MGGSRPRSSCTRPRSGKTPSSARTAVTRPTSRRSRPSCPSRSRSTDCPSRSSSTRRTRRRSPTLVDHANAHLAARCEGEWTAAHTLKNVVLALTHLDGTRELVIVGLPGDRDVDDKRVEVAFAPADGRGRDRGRLRAQPAAHEGLHRPLVADRRDPRRRVGHRHPLPARSSRRRGTSWITGANIDQKHVHSLVAGRDFDSDGFVEVSTVRAGIRRRTAPARSRSRAAWRSDTSSSSVASTPTRSD